MDSGFRIGNSGCGWCVGLASRGQAAVRSSLLAMRSEVERSKRSALRRMLAAATAIERRRDLPGLCLQGFVQGRG